MGLNEIQLYSKLWKCNNIYLIDNRLWINYGNSKLILLLPRRYSESSKSINRHHAMFFLFFCLCYEKTKSTYIQFVYVIFVLIVTSLYLPQYDHQQNLILFWLSEDQLTPYYYWSVKTVTFNCISRYYYHRCML